MYMIHQFDLAKTLAVSDFKLSDLEPVFLSTSVLWRWIEMLRLTCQLDPMPSTQLLPLKVDTEQVETWSAGGQILTYQSLYCNNFYLIL